MPDKRDETTLESDIAVHILSVSAAMVGVCLTVIGLFRISVKSNVVSSIGDELLACDAAAFLGACLLAYLALRSRHQRRKHLVERAADVLFLLALLTMAVICALVAYEFV